MRTGLNIQFITGCIQITLIGFTLADITASIMGRNVIDNQAIADLLKGESEEEEDQFKNSKKDVKCFRKFTCKWGGKGSPSALSHTTSV